ncbi:MAG TPA: FtsH protease activity modulator HflK [Alphaproteobacteria bacterium]|nr:FtsH protease activity modulator HflK [Alphaproteobacteria bacterium]
MPWEKKSNQGKGGNGGGKNPWGKSPGNDHQNQWGGMGGGGNGGEPPDIDEMLRRAQQNLRTVFPGGMSHFKIAGLAFIAVAVLWLASGFYVVNPGEHAVIQRFGAWSRTQAEPGLGYHLPVPLETATILNVQQIRKMSIGYAEGFSRTGASARQDVPEESLMLTSDRNIVDLDMVIQWSIKSSEDFLFNIQDPEATIKKVAESAIREVVGQSAMFPIITTARDAVAKNARAIIQQNLDQYKSGVNITGVLIERAEVHPDVQSAFQDVQSAKQDAEDVQNRAEAYREDILPKARGRAIQMVQDAEAYKQSTVARSTGDAQRFNDIYESYLTGQDVTKERIFIETMESVLKNAEKIILDQPSGSGSGVVPYLPLNELGNKRPAPAAAEPQTEASTASDQFQQ